MRALKTILTILGVTLISACSMLEQAPAPNDTVSRNLNEMKASPRAASPKADPRDGDLGQANRKISDLERELATAQAASSASQVAASDLDKSRGQLTDLEKQLADRNLRVASLERQLADRDQELARLRGDLSAEMQKLSQAQRGLLRALRSEIQKGDITVDLNSERLLINLASAYLFGLGEDQLKPAGVDALKQVGAILKDYPEYNMEVAGHTDNLAIRSKLKEKFPTNQALSEARAANAVKALTEGGMAANALTGGGYAETKPVAPNTTEAGRQKNRRVEIRVTPKS